MKGKCTGKWIFFPVNMVCKCFCFIFSSSFARSQVFVICLFSLAAAGQEGCALSGSWVHRHFLSATSTEPWQQEGLSLSLLSPVFCPQCFFSGWQSLIFHKCQMGMEWAWKHWNFLLAEADNKCCRGDGGEGCEIGGKNDDQIWDQGALIFLPTAALDFNEVTEWAKGYSSSWVSEL